MARILRVELRIQGEYRDLWLYKERLHLWDRSGVLRYVKFNHVINHVTRLYGIAIANLVQTFIFRNDWKAGEQFTSWMRVPGVAENILKPFESDELLIVELPETLFTISGSQAYAGLVLDTNLYADRVYLATAEGLLESYINSKYPEATYELHQQTDFRASRVAVKYSAINISAEARGLHFAPVRFWSGDVNPGFMKAEWRQVADFSLASSYARRNLLNYTQSAAPSLLYARVEQRRSERARHEDTVVVGYDPTPADLTGLAYSASIARGTKPIKATQTGSQVDETFEILGNSDYHLLTSTADQLKVIDLRAKVNRELEAIPNQKFQKSDLPPVNSDIIGTYAINRGFVVEYYDQLHLITTDGHFSLADGETAQVRTFESSKRHKEAIAVVQESSASVFGYYIQAEIADVLF